MLYVNTSASAKALADYIVTSSTAAKVIKRIPSDTVIFGPDSNLADYVQSIVRDKRIIKVPPNGRCIVHSGYTVGMVRRARERSTFMHKIEVEVTNAEDEIKAVKAGADAVLIDNITPQQLEEIIKRLEDLGLRDSVIIEVSGGINPSNVIAYAQAGPNVISTSHITMRATPVDISLEVIEVSKGGD